MPGLFYVSSLRVPDANCNVGYLWDASTPSAEQIEAIERTAAAKSREPAIFHIVGQPVPDGYGATSQEVWMVADTSQAPEITVPEGVSRTYVPLPAAEMVEIFDDVFCQGKGDVGYTDTPREYIDVYRQHAPDPPTKPFHVGVYLDKECAAISNVNILGKTAGLYSVAVRQGHRRKGLGRLVTTEGMKLAAKEGATTIILQTKLDSPMQTMYESVGFKKAFVSELLTKKS